MTNPQVSVLMSVYNGEKYLREAIESILDQTFNDFELIIINDASTDNSKAIVYSFHDRRIKLVDNLVNLGLARSLNKGLKIARGNYVARMDTDDISLPERLAVQVDFMESHGEVGVCGTWIRTIGNKTGVEFRFASDHETLRCNLLFSPQIVHPSVIMRREPMIMNELFYNPAYLAAQDFDLWRRCSQYFCFANINHVLLLYRWHNEQSTKSKYDVQQKYAGLVRLEEIKNLGVQPSEAEFQLHQEICMSMPKTELSRSFYEKSYQWLNKLKAANKISNYYPEPTFLKMIDTVLHNFSTKCGIKAPEI